MDSGEILLATEASRQFKKIKTIPEAQVSINQEISYFPEEIIVEILSRLPVQALLKFKCVSKSWLAIISSPKFIKMHFHRSVNDRNLFNYKIISAISSPNFNLKQFSVHSLMSEPLTKADCICYPEKDSQLEVMVVGSCNGLVCISVEDEGLFLWNPSTRKSKKLPSPKMKIGLWNSYGFGFNESDGDYKVVGIVAGEYWSTAKVYSLKTDSWKKIGHFKGGLPLNDSGKFAGRKLHWFASGDDIWDYRRVIVSLDLENEEYGIVEQPTYDEGCLSTTLCVLEGRICILCNYQNICGDVWVQKEYGVKESWMKIATIPHLNYTRSSSPKPLCISANGEIILVMGNKFVVYNLKNKRTKTPRISNIRKFWEAEMYVESLVSPLEIV